jgi:hypothetical protein
MVSDREERNPLDVVKEFLPTVGFEYKAGTAFSSGWYRAKEGFDCIDSVNIYPHWGMDGGEFKLVLYGNIEDLSTLLHGISLEQVEMVRESLVKVCNLPACTPSATGQREFTSQSLAYLAGFRAALDEVRNHIAPLFKDNGGVL